MKKNQHIIIANWKMNPETSVQAVALIQKIKKISTNRTSVVVCPPAVFLPLLVSKKGKIIFGGQDCASENSGPFTGSISPTMLKSIGAEFVILGHSERRAAGETDQRVAKKVAAALEAKLTVILCIGENERDEEGVFIQTLIAQLRASLKNVSLKYASKIIIAYEPVWAISSHASGIVTPEQLQETAILIRKTLFDIFGEKEGSKVAILYGGSVNANDVGSFVSVAGISGFLVGHASLEAKEFKDIISIVDKAGVKV